MTDLNSVFQDATNRARRLTASRFELYECEANSPDYPAPQIVAGRGRPWREVWRVVYSATPPVLPCDMELIAAIPACFPDELPHIYLPAGEAKRLGSIPHLDQRRFICTFDATEVTPNCDSHPGEIVLATLERAHFLCCEGASGRNARDFQEEFDAYWVQDAELESLSLIDPDDQPREVVVTGVKAFGAGSHLFSETKAQAERWFENVNYPFGARKTALYLPLQTLGKPPYPTTNREMWDRLNECAPEHIERLVDFLAHQERPTAILFSIPALASQDGERTLGAWWHPMFHYKAPRGPKSVRQSGVIAGFRPGPDAVKLELLSRHRDNKLIRAHVTRVDAARLSKRTKGTVSDAFLQPVNVIGCGSLGSYFAAALAAEGGIQELRIVDSQRLGVENTPRHLCSWNRVGQFKAQAVATEIAARLPHIKTESHDSDLLSLLLDKPLLFSRSSLSVIAIGDLAVERRLNRLAKADPQTWSHPLCFIWVEPHLYGGHAVWLRPEQNGCLECVFDESLYFTERVLEHPERYTRREAGCQTTFVPYGGADVMAFTAALTRFALKAAAGEENRIFSWTGDLDQARRDGVALRDQWQEAASFSTRVRPLTPKPSCPACRAATRL